MIYCNFLFLVHIPLKYPLRVSLLIPRGYDVQDVMILQLEDRELTGLGGVPAQVHLPTPLTVQYEYLEGGGTAIPVMYDLAQLNPDPSLCALVA